MIGNFSMDILMLDKNTLTKITSHNGIVYVTISAKHIAYRLIDYSDKINISCYIVTIIVMTETFY